MAEKAKKIVVERMRKFLQAGLNGSYRHLPCATEVAPMLEAFFEQSVKRVEEILDETELAHIMSGQLECVMEAAMNVALNTRNYEPLTAEEFEALQRIFAELKLLQNEVVGSWGILDKIRCICEIACKNMVGMRDTKNSHERYRDGMIFQKYDDLYKIIHRVNTEWEDLCKRGFSVQVFYDYWQALPYTGIKTEEEKMELLMSLLDGRIKFQPVYKAVAYRMVPLDSVEIVLKNKDFPPYQMTSN